jgi:hypothetical protein
MKWKFRDHIDEWIDTVDEPGLTRAWHIVRECINVHAIVDRDPEENLSEARHLAWKDFFEAWFGGEATYTYMGLVHELAGFCPDGLEECMEARMREAWCIFRGLEIPSPWPGKPVIGKDGRPRLVLVTLGDELGI